MLYISSLVGRYAIEVVDTDDNSIETVTHQDIVKATNLGVDIKGVVFNKSATFFGSKLIQAVEPYQVESELTPAQVKMKVMRHVDVKLHSGRITQIKWDVDKITEPVSIRLSDFARASADRILYNNPLSGIHRVTLIFDDKFQLSDKALCLTGGVKDKGIKFDLREVTDFFKALSVYRQLLDRPSDADIFVDILDNVDRKADMASRLSVPVEYWPMLG